MPHYNITGVYIGEQYENTASSPYFWRGSALNTKAAVKKLQAKCRKDNDWENAADNLVDIIDIWEIHPADVARDRARYKKTPAGDSYVRMRPRRIP